MPTPSHPLSPPPPPSYYTATAFSSEIWRKKTVSRPHPPRILRLSYDKKINSNGHDVSQEKDVCLQRDDVIFPSLTSSFFVILIAALVIGISVLPLLVPVAVHVLVASHTNLITATGIISPSLKGQGHEIQ
jgi:hypothetical protein